MSRKRYTPEQIIGTVWEAEVRLSQGETATKKTSHSGARKREIEFSLNIL